MKGKENSNFTHKLYKIKKKKERKTIQKERESNRL